MFTVNKGDIVVGSPSYEVVVGGVFEVLDFVLCKVICYDCEEATCMFLAGTVVGMEEF
jgi:hypothetical protein